MVSSRNVCVIQRMIISFDEGLINMAGYRMAQNAAVKAYEQAGIGPEDVDVVELHDCFASNEVITYEALGLTPEGTAEKFIQIAAAEGLLLYSRRTAGGRFGEWVMITPPLIISETQVDELLHLLKRSLDIFQQQTFTQ